jgi:hypothetical protein
MRTFWTIFLTFIVTVLLIGIGGYVYHSNVLNTYLVTAEVNEWGHLEITGHVAQSVRIYGVGFNDRGMNECTPRPGPNFVFKDYLSFNQPANRWVYRWIPSDRVRLEEGRMAIAPFDRSQCGDTIVKATIYTDLGNYTFFAPKPSSTALTTGKTVALYQGW